MPIFITQGRFTSKGVEGLLNKPEDRTKAVEALMKGIGGKLLNYYVTTGEYDFMIIAEGSSEQNIIAALLAASSTGTVTDLRTVTAITAADAKSVYEKAQSMRANFQPAGA